MKKNVYAMLIVAVLAVSLAGCGGQAVEDVVADAKTIENIDGTDKTESSEAMLPETSVSMREETVTEASGEEVSYVERDSFYQIKGAYNDGIFYDVSTLEPVSKTYTLEKSVDVYFLDTDLAGYTKDGISVYVISSNDEWSYCSIDKVGLLLKTDELMDAVAKPVVAEATPSAPVAESPKPESTPVESEPAMDIPVVEEPVAVESDKYTPEEAIAVYRSLMEANGIAWNPSLRDGGSWGTGIFYLEKGWIEDNIDSQLAAFQYGSGDGVPCTNYYLEVTGFDENCVYIIEWSD